jgi:hypothetical protein
MRHRGPSSTAILLGLLALVPLAGCGIHGPDQNLNTTTPTVATASTRTLTTTEPPEPAQPADDDDDGPAQTSPPQRSTAEAAGTPQSAIERFAHLYTNWTASQLPQRAGQLAALSIGQAHTQALALAHAAATLERYQVTNRGTVVAIASGQGQEHGRWAVITNELTSGTGPYLGLPGTSHVTWATVTHQHGGYVIATWYPSS